MLNKMITFIGCALICLLLMSGCAEYSEDSFDNYYKSNKAFAQMTVQEKILHDKVKNSWGQEKLLGLRDIVRQRPGKPDEDSIPFVDLAKTIVTINDVVLNPDGQSNDRRNSRFSVISPKWFSYIEEVAAGRKKAPTQEYIEVMEEEPKESETEEPKEKEEVEVAEFKEPAPVVYNPGDVAEDDAVKSLRLSLLMCDEARAYFDEIVDAGRPVLNRDVNKIRELTSICRAREMKSFYTD